MDKDTAELVVFLVLYLIFTVAAFTWLLIRQRRMRGQVSALLAAADWGTFLQGLKGFAEPLYKRAKALQGAIPYYDQEYPSFYHHLYVPYRLECHERQCRSFAKIMKVFVWVGVGCFAFTALLSLFGFALLEMDNWYLFLLIGLLMVLIACISFAMFYVLLRLSTEEFEMLQSLDRKMLVFGNGMEPYPYRVHVSQVLAYQDFLAR